jgi:hypothetical protein
VAPGIPARIAAGFQLFQVGDAGQVNLGGQVPAHGRAEALRRTQRAAGQGPPSPERRLAPLPEQDMKAVAADLEDHGQGFMGELLIAGHVRMVLTRLVLAHPGFRL